MTVAASASVPKKALLIAPTAFYSFAKLMARGLESRGYEVVIANDEYPSNVLGKLLGKLRIPFILQRITERVLGERFLGGARYALVVIVKGRGLSPKLIARLKQHADRVVAYNFDSFGFNPAPLPWIRLVDKYCTFDFADAEAYGLPRVDLFSSLPMAENGTERRYFLSAILRNHSDRLKYLDRVLSALPHGEKRIYIFESSLITLVFNAIKNPLLYWRYRGAIHTTSLPYPEYVSILADSVFTLDFAHPKQTGITIRCFEAAASGTKLITNNPFTLRHPYFSDANVVVFGLKEPPAALREYLSKPNSDMPSPQARTLDHFFDEILS